MANLPIAEIIPPTMKPFTQIVPNMPTAPPTPTGQLVVQPRPTPTGGMRPVTGTATTVNPTALPGGTPRPAGPGVASRVASGLVKGGAVGALMTPNTMGDAELPMHMRENPFATMEGADTVFGPQMSKLGDEPMSFPAPTGPSATPARTAPIAVVQPPEAGLMGSAGVTTPAVPISTFNVDQGSVTVPSALADQTIQDSLTPNQPLRNVNELISSGRGAYEGQNLADFIGYRDTPESATEQFLDPQGRLRRRDIGTGELTEQYSEYEKQAAAREQRAEEQFGVARGPDARDRDAGEMSAADARDMAKLRDPNATEGEKARAMQVAERLGRDPMTGAPVKTGQVESDKLKIEEQRLENERKQQVIDAGRKPDATPRQKKRGEWEEMQEDMEADGMSPEEIAARRKSFLYGDPFDSYLFEGGGDKEKSPTAEEEEEEGGGAKGKLGADTAKQLLEEAGGDKTKARQLAKERGYTL